MLKLYRKIVCTNCAHIEALWWVVTVATPSFAGNAVHRSHRIVTQKEISQVYDHTITT